MSNFHPLEFVSRYRDPQLQVGGNLSDLNIFLCQQGGEGGIPPFDFVTGCPPPPYVLL